MHQSKPKKILFFTENYERGGGNRYLFDLATMAKNSGNSVRIYSNFFGLEQTEIHWFENLQMTYQPVSILSWGELRARFQLRKNFALKLLSRMIYLPLMPLVWLYQLIIFVQILKTEKPDLVVGSNGGYPAGGAVNRFLWVSSWLKIPCYNSIVNVPSTEFVDQLRMMFWDQIIPKICRKIIIDSQEISKQLRSHGFPLEKFIIVYNGLKGNLPYDPRSNTRVRILFFARLELIKGIDHFIEAISRLNQTYSDQIEVHIYGAGTFTDAARDLAQKFPRNIYFHGFFEGDFQSIFVKSDVYVLPSLMEGLPYTVLEAMKAGCCIVSTQVGGLPELVVNGKSGLLIAPHNIEELVQALEKVIKDSKLREEFGRAAKAKFDAEFEQSAIFEIHNGLFND